jgi:hypothetical protein
MFEVITYKDHEITDTTLKKRAQKEQEQHRRPFQISENTKVTQLRSLSTTVKERVKAAQEFGTTMILSTLSPRPSLHHIRDHESEYWWCIANDSYFRFEGVDDPDF